MGLGAPQSLQDRGWKAASGRYSCIAPLFWVSSLPSSPPRQVEPALPFGKFPFALAVVAWGKWAEMP